MNGYWRRTIGIGGVVLLLNGCTIFGGRTQETLPETPAEVATCEVPDGWPIPHTDLDPIRRLMADADRLERQNQRNSEVGRPELDTLRQQVLDRLRSLFAERDVVFQDAESSDVGFTYQHFLPSVGADGRITSPPSQRPSSTPSQHDEPRAFTRSRDGRVLGVYFGHKAFRSVEELIAIALHEWRHVQQFNQWGGRPQGFENVTLAPEEEGPAAEVDAYIFTALTAGMSQISGDAAEHMLGKLIENWLMLRSETQRSFQAYSLARERLADLRRDRRPCQPRPVPACPTPSAAANPLEALGRSIDRLAMCTANRLQELGWG